MAKAKSKSIKTLQELLKAIRKAPEDEVRTCLFYIAREAFLENGELNRDKELDSDFIGEVVNHLEAFGFVPDAE